VVEERDGYELSDERERLDLDGVERLLRGAFWAKNRPREVIVRSIENSFVLGVKHSGEQVAFARVVTDYATFAWLCDVIVDEAHRGKGIGKWMMDVLTAHPRLQGFRRWLLATRWTSQVCFTKGCFKPHHSSFAPSLLWFIASW
jgi:GNAT superfamily N-acetyltransferase